MHYDIAMRENFNIVTYISCAVLQIWLFNFPYLCSFTWPQLLGMLLDSTKNTCSDSSIKTEEQYLKFFEF